MHCIFLGAAGVGKSSLMKRLLGEKVDIAHRTSTKIAEKSVRVVSTAVAEVPDLAWKKIDNNAVVCGLMGQMSKEHEMKSKQANQKEHKQENRLKANEVSNHREGSTQASVKVQKDKPPSAVKDANKEVPEQKVSVSKQDASKQQDRVPDDSQATKDHSHTTKKRVPDDSQATNSTDDSQATEKRVPGDSQPTNSTARGSSNSQQLQSIAFLRISSFWNKTVY